MTTGHGDSVNTSFYIFFEALRFQRSLPRATTPFELVAELIRVPRKKQGVQGGIFLRDLQLDGKRLLSFHNNIPTSLHPAIYSRFVEDFTANYRF